MIEFSDQLSQDISYQSFSHLYHY